MYILIVCKCEQQCVDDVFENINTLEMAGKCQIVITICDFSMKNKRQCTLVSGCLEMEQTSKNMLTLRLCFSSIALWIQSFQKCRTSMRSRKIVFNFIIEKKKNIIRHKMSMHNLSRQRIAHENRLNEKHITCMNSIVMFPQYKSTSVESFPHENSHATLQSIAERMAAKKARCFGNAAQQSFSYLAVSYQNETNTITPYKWCGLHSKQHHPE